MFSTDLDELRTWPTERLRSERDAARVEERRWRLRRVALDRVLDERGATGGREAAEWVQGRDQVRPSTARAEVEIARSLESLPCVAAAAEAGDLSFDQLEHIVQLATPDRRGVGRARRTRRRATSPVAAPAAVSGGDAATAGRGAALVAPGEWLRLNGQIPDVNGALVEAVLEHLVNGMKPPKGNPGSRATWADALVELPGAPVPGRRPCEVGEALDAAVVIHVGSDAQPEVNGMPIAVETVQQLITDGAAVREVHDGDPLAPVSGDMIPAALRDHLVARDPECRVPGCERTFGLDAHHLVPRSRGGPTEKRNLAMICKVHHRRAVPHGPFVLEGDPERLDGLAWHRIDEPGRGAGEARAGPAA